MIPIFSEYKRYYYSSSYYISSAAHTRVLSFSQLQIRNPGRFQISLAHSAVSRMQLLPDVRGYSGTADY